MLPKLFRPLFTTWVQRKVQVTLHSVSDSIISIIVWQSNISSFWFKLQFLNVSLNLHLTFSSLKKKSFEKIRISDFLFIMLFKLILIIHIKHKLVPGSWLLVVYVKICV